MATAPETATSKAAEEMDTARLKRGSDVSFVKLGDSVEFRETDPKTGKLIKKKILRSGENN